jgi:murein DD-endopeptidase MepM/ murein hydrolase activator NlpD
VKQWLAAFLSILGLCVLVSCRSSGQRGGGGLLLTRDTLPTDTTVSVLITAESTPTPKPQTSQQSITQTPISTPALAPNPPTDTSYQICSPLALQSLAELSEIVADPYEPPPPGREERHHGVDFSYYRRGDRLSIMGEGIRSVFPGRVAAVVLDKYPYGNMVIVESPGEDLPIWLEEKFQIDDGESLFLLYAHMDQAPLVELGDSIEACHHLGEVGKSGDFNVEHLHLETRIGPVGTTFDGMAYYHTRTTPEERANYELWRTSGEYRHFDPMMLFALAVDSLESIDQGLVP